MESSSSWSSEALEQTLAELEALQAIYEEDFTIHTDLTTLKEKDSSSSSSCCCFIETSLSLIIDGQNVQLRIKLPPDYPISSSSPAQTFVSVSGWTRKQEEQATLALQAKAALLAGQEAVMELIYELQDLVQQTTTGEHQNGEPTTCTAHYFAQQRHDASEHSLLGRRWIWAHHITDSARRKSIVAEARELELGGYLKSGYPGIVVVEGVACDEFVSWIKGSKSRPGGFGRNWGHHVKGEVTVDRRQLPRNFVELEDMQDLGSLCKEHGLEDEFLEFVMQHKVKKGSESDSK